MASPSVSDGDSFLRQVARARERIGVKFRRAHQVLQEREAALLLELQQLEDRYSGEGVAEQIREITASKEQLMARMKRNENQPTLKESVALLDARMRELEVSLGTVKDRLGSVAFEWDGELERMLSGTGVIRMGAVLDYKKKGKPVLVACKHRETDIPTDGVLDFVTSIVICPQSENVYISDDYNCIQVFNKSLKFLFKFSDELDSPSDMCISQNKLFVTQFDGNSLNVYSTEGKFLRSVGREGNKKLEFTKPSGVSVSSLNNRIYVCEIANNRIQCLNSDLTFHSFIHDSVQSLKIHCTSDEIIVLKRLSPCISFYDYSHQLMRDIIPAGEGTPIINPMNFCLDHQNNILLVDFSSHCVVIFSNNGDLIHKFGQKGKGRGKFIHPCAIALDSEDRIIVTSLNPDHSVQLF